MKEVTISLLTRRTDGQITEICLGMKKRGFGKGKWNGFGGKVGDVISNETAKEAAIREVAEEAGVQVGKIIKVAELTFSNPDGSEDIVFSHVYLISEWAGEITESNEMRPQWFKASAIPYDQMWSADRYWIPEVLQGNKIKAEFFYDEKDQCNHNVEIHQVKVFSE